jgi:hypothetical protein
MTKIKETLRSISFYRNDRSTPSLDPEALEGRPSTGRIPSKRSRVQRLRYGIYHAQT